MAIAPQITRLARHSLVYGFAPIIQVFVGIVFLPLYTHYLSRADYGAVETLVALSGVLTILLRAGVETAFFRFYLRTKDLVLRRRLVRTSFWFTMASGTFGLIVIFTLAGPIADAIFGGPHREPLVRASAVALWSQINFDQLQQLFRAEERSTAFTIANVANLLITVGATFSLVAFFHKGPLGVIIGNFTGTLVVYAVLLAYHREQLGFEFDRELFRSMQRWGMALVPAGLAMWTVNAIDRFLLVRMAGQSETGLYSLAVRVSSIVMFLVVAFRTAWPAFAWGIEEDERAKRAYAFVLTYLFYIACWMSLGLSVLSPWILTLAASSNHTFWPASRAVPILAFGTVAYCGYVITSTGAGRVGANRINWLIASTAAVVNIVLNVILIPPYGMMGAAIATLAAYLSMFVFATVRTGRIFPVPYQWRRVGLIIGVSVGLTILAKVIHASTLLDLGIALSFPLVLVPLGFYRPDEWEHMRRILGSLRVGRA